MAHQRSEQPREGEQVLDADLAQHLGLLDWIQLDPIGEGQVMAGADNEAGFFDNLGGGEIVEDEGTDEPSESEEEQDASEVEMVVHRRRGGSGDDQVAAPVVTTGHRSRSPSQGGRGHPSVTTGHIAAGQGANVSARTRSRGRASGSLSTSSVSGAQAHDPSTDPTDPTEQSGSGESKGKKRKSALNLDDIDDPAERRKQRRLAKNRATAAVSRERKRVQMVQLAGRTRALEQENANLQFMLGLRDQEISRLRQELVSLPRGAGSLESSVTVATSPTEPAALTGTALPICPPHSSIVMPPVVVASPAAPGAAGGDSSVLGVNVVRVEGQGGSLPGEQQLGEVGGSWAGSTQNSRSLAGSTQNSRSLPDGGPGVGLVAGQPAELVARGNSHTTPGVIVGVDGQWLRLRQPGLQPAPLPAPRGDDTSVRDLDGEKNASCRRSL